MDKDKKSERATPRQILDMNAFDMSVVDADDNSLLGRRQKNAGEFSVLFYQKPIEMIAASGVWMESASGERYLDLYNNVPSVGHNHPHVVDAVTKQFSQLNTNTRYLNPTVEHYVERLKALLPTSLNKITLCCTGSEANDLALRLVSSATGSTGIVVTETAYHGNTSAVVDVSPAAAKQDTTAAHVRVIPAPSSRNYGDDIVGGFNNDVETAINSLLKSRYGFAGFLADSIFSSDGVYPHPAGFLKETIDTVHRSGGYYIADEVQPGFSRTGTHFWGFERHDIKPDIVTMGKPMGNGYPMAGLATSTNLQKALAAAAGYFNTFGGSTVAAAAGCAVLDVIENEQLQNNARKTGAYLLQQLELLSTKIPAISEIRGAGLYLGIEFCNPDVANKPDPETATRVIEALRAKRILIGASGPYGNILKVRPPLCLCKSDADIFIHALTAVLD